MLSANSKILQTKRLEEAAKNRGAKMGPKANSKTTKGNKQNGNKSNGGKLQSQHARAANEQNGESEVDYSMLTKPIQFGRLGIVHALKIYQSGTPEVEDITTIIQPQPAPASDFETWKTSDAIPTSAHEKNDLTPTLIETSIPRIINNKSQKKDLSLIIEKLTQQRAEENLSDTFAQISASKFYNDVNEQLVLQKDARKEKTVHLEAVENTHYGVFQTMMPTNSTNQMENTDLMKTQGVLEKNSEALLFSMSTYKVACNQLLHFKGNTRFSTRKTLNHHMKSLHVTFRMCYPCPCCKNTFCNTWSVYRHLYKVHRKTTLQVRKLRSQIVNKAFRKEVSDETNSKSNAPIQTEADKALKEQQRLHQENQASYNSQYCFFKKDISAWMNNFEGDLELQMCGGCGRRFERRAALNSHSQICQKRIAIQNNIKARRLSPTNTTSTTNTRVTGTKVLPPSHNPPHAETSRNDNLTGENTNRLTPLSIQSEGGNKCAISPSPSPVPLDVTNRFLTSSPSAAFHRTRHCSGSSVAKKEVPEKRIEIQIRRDYCKSGASSSGCSGSATHQHDCNSESNENALPRSITENEDENSNFNEDTKLYQSRELGLGVLRKDNDTPTLNVCRYPGRRCAPEINTVTIDCDNDDHDFDDASSIRSVPDSGNRSSNQSDRSTNSSRVGSAESDKLRRMSFTSEGQDETSPITSNANSRRASHNSDVQVDVINTPESLSSKSTPTSNSKKEEHFSPVMERRMQSMINIQRIQCLPCQKKFNKLTNLRRHVAVHIGWNRYRCIECSFKCFSKYDCVAHVNKLHLEKPDRDKAQSMVQYIETQVSDSDFTNRAHGEDRLQDAHDLEIKSENLSAYLENDNQNKDTSDWSPVESYEVMNDNVETVLKQEPELEDSTQHTLENYEDKQEDDSDVLAKNELTVNKPLMTYTMRSGKGNESQAKENTREVDSVREKPSRGRPRKRCASTDVVELGCSGAATPKKMLTSEFQQNTTDTTLDNDIDNDKPKMDEIDDTDNESVEVNESPDDSPRKIQELQQQTELRKMVLQVIFGAGNSSVNQDVEGSENMFSLTMNGEAGHSGASASSPESYDVVEAVSSDSGSPLTTIGSTTSPVAASDDAVDVPEQSLQVKEETKNAKQNKVRNSVTPTFEIERRQRPVRNRVKVEREDFIYDLSDRCLDPKRDDSKLTKRKQQESVKVLVDNKGNSSTDSSVKLLPKLMLVRTSVGEYSGVKMVKSGNLPQALDSSPEKNALGYNISTRKSQRTFDISPHKNLNSNK
ncbi:hypothetical protein C0J52_22115 [Blattella germanica]|nr:hypothetical protein C0J52_22115 [Blattella germanica]